MANPLSGFGKFLKLKGKSWSGDSTAVPLPLLQNLKTNTPIPIVQTASTFVVNAGVTSPVNIWNGNDFIQLKETLTYTWATSAQLTINSSGATVAATVSGATVYYFYIAQDTAGALQLAPSPTYPRYVEGPYEGGFWMHPGTSRGKYWNYVGWQQCTATTPVMLKMEKAGYLYLNPTPTACGVADVCKNASAPAAYNLAGLVPVHDGVEMSGWGTALTEGASAWIGIGSTSLSANQFRIAGATANAVPFGPITVQGAGATFWATGSVTFTNGGPVNITTIRDVV